MATSLSTLCQRTRRFLRDWPDEDVLSASCASNAATITVADATKYADNWALEIDQEIVVVTSTASAGATVAVRRGARGSTAASHAASSVILVKPAFFTIEIIDALNIALEAAYPYIYQMVVDETLSGSAQTYEYTVPDLPGHTGTPIPFISRVEVKESGDSTFREVRDWRVMRGDTPKIKFRRETIGGEDIRVIGYGPLPRLTSITDTLDGQFPINAEGLLVEFAASHLLASGESGRVRLDVGAVDTRENANVTGSSLRISENLRTRFYNRLSNAGMSPVAPHFTTSV